jgi:hypothetical protein
MAPPLIGSDGAPFKANEVDAPTCPQLSLGRDLLYRSGRSKCWIKVKNPASPAMLSIENGTF